MFYRIEPGTKVTVNLARPKGERPRRVTGRIRQSYNFLTPVKPPCPEKFRFRLNQRGDTLDVLRKDVQW